MIDILIWVTWIAGIVLYFGAGLAFMYLAKIETDNTGCGSLFILIIWPIPATAGFIVWLLGRFGIQR